MKFFAFVAIEIFFFTFFAEKYGFLNTLLVYWIPTLLGLSLMPRLGFKLRGFKLNPSNEASGLHQVLVFLGCGLLITPLLTFRVLGVFLILPGLRHILIWRLAQVLKTKMHQFQAQPNGFYFFKSHSFSQSPRGFEYRSDFPREIKDVTPQNLQIEKPKH